MSHLAAINQAALAHVGLSWLESETLAFLRKKLFFKAFEQQIALSAPMDLHLNSSFKNISAVLGGILKFALTCLSIN